MGLITVTPPAAEPLAASDMRAQLRLDADETHEDALIGALIASARARTEAFLRRRLITQTVRLERPPICGGMAVDLPVAPVQSVTSIAYTDTAGDAVTLDPARYRLVTSRARPLVLPVYGTTWPSMLDEPDALRITLVVGYGAAGSDVPADILHGIRQIVAHLYQFRENTAPTQFGPLPLGAEHMLSPHRLWL